MNKRWIYLTMVMLVEILLGVLYFACNLGETNEQMVVYIGLSVGLFTAAASGLLKKTLNLEIASSIPLGISAGICWGIQLLVSIFLILGKSEFKTCILTEIGCVLFIILIETGVYRIVSTE